MKGMKKEWVVCLFINSHSRQQNGALVLKFKFFCFAINLYKKRNINENNNKKVMVRKPKGNHQAYKE